MIIEDSKYVKINSVDPLHLEYEELWSKIKDLIRSVTKSLDDYDEEYTKIKL